MISYKKANREYYEYYECTTTTSGQAITANRQTNGQAITTSTSSTTNGQMSTTHDQTNSASTMSDKISSAIITILH